MVKFYGNKKAEKNFLPGFWVKNIWFLSDIFSHWLLRNLCYDGYHETAKFGENKIGGISRLFCVKTVFISFLRQVEVRPLGNINFGIDYDTGNPLNTKITEPRVQTRLCLAEKMGFEPMHHVYLRSTPLAGEPLEPLGYFSNCAAERSRLDYDNTKIGNSQSLFGNKKRKILVCFCCGGKVRGF